MSKLCKAGGHLQSSAARVESPHTVEAGGIQLGRAAVLIMLTRTGSCCDEFNTDPLRRRRAK